jgi:AraC-like DNA-binding protein
LTWRLACRLGDICYGRTRPRRISLYSLGILLAEHLLDMAARADKASHPRLLNRQLHSVIEWLDLHFSEKITVTDMARVAGMSCFHFARLFKSTTGYSPHRYLTIRRLQTVNELFRQGDMRVSEIALATGFSDQSHLDGTIRKFCKEGLLPEGFRKRLPKQSKNIQ